MKSIALLCLAGGLLVAAAAPADAHQPGRYDDDSDSSNRYHQEFERRHAMPRWLRQQRSFRHWYRESPYQRRLALSWANVYDIYRQEHRYERRYRNDRYYYDRRRDRQRRRH